jgi:hypothetical protein
MAVDAGDQLIASVDIISDKHKVANIIANFVKI